MPYLIGLILALLTATLAAVVGLDRGRAFYSTVLIVVATYYILFAVMGGSSRALVSEIVVAAGFTLVSIIGFKLNTWIVAAALVGHGLFDSVHHLIIQNPGVPAWWPGFCLAFDATIGVFLAIRQIRKNAMVKM